MIFPLSQMKIFNVPLVQIKFFVSIVSKIDIHRTLLDRQIQYSLCYITFGFC
jgi:hypothetical protein